MSRMVLILILLLLTAGCTHALHLNHTGDIQPLGQGTRIRSQAEQFTVMGIVTQTDYVNEAYAQLQKKCEGGSVTGIQTRYSTSHGFFSWTNKINMVAYCVKGRRQS